MTSPKRLDETEPGAQVRVVRLLSSDARQRLMQLGLVPGTIVSVRQIRSRGPVIVRLRGCTLALDRELARSVEVANDPGPAPGARP